MGLMSEVAKIRNIMKEDSVKFWNDLLEMVTMDEREKHEILSHFFAYLHVLLEDEENYDGSVKNLQVNIKNLVALYYVVRIDLFIKAWTYALSMYNYRKAISEVKKVDLNYIG